MSGNILSEAVLVFYLNYKVSVIGPAAKQHKYHYLIVLQEHAGLDQPDGE